ncbi:hypothetical protein [Burkholderia sp. F1]|uniref:hypothetical protein n=1 Tax=Burkholderia sp. F1 TaxID=3366817 RepID=UPI003D7338DB
MNRHKVRTYHGDYSAFLNEEEEVFPEPLVRIDHLTLTMFGGRLEALANGGRYGVDCYSEFRAKQIIACERFSQKLNPIFNISTRRTAIVRKNPDLPIPDLLVA